MPVTTSQHSEGRSTKPYRGKRFSVPAAGVAVLLTCGALTSCTIDDADTSIPVATVEPELSQQEAMKEGFPLVVRMTARSFDAYTEEELVYMAEGLCGQLNVESLENLYASHVADVVLGSPITVDDYGSFAGAAIPSYCPQHEPKLDSLIALLNGESVDGGGSVAPEPEIQPLAGYGCDRYISEVPDGDGSIAKMADQYASTAISNNPFLTEFASATSGEMHQEIDLMGWFEEGPMTIFAPNDDALGSLRVFDQATHEALLADPNLFSSFLLHHVVEGEKIYPEDIVGTHTTATGEQVTVEGGEEEEGVLTVDGASIMCGFETVNATVYMIDAVLKSADVLSAVPREDFSDVACVGAMYAYVYLDASVSCEEAKAILQTVLDTGEPLGARSQVTAEYECYEPSAVEQLEGSADVMCWALTPDGSRDYVVLEAYHL